MQARFDVQARRVLAAQRADRGRSAGFVVFARARQTVPRRAVPSVIVRYFYDFHQCA